MIQQQCRHQPTQGSRENECKHSLLFPIGPKQSSNSRAGNDQDHGTYEAECSSGGIAGVAPYSIQYLLGFFLGHVQELLSPLLEQASGKGASTGRVLVPDDSQLVAFLASDQIYVSVLVEVCVGNAVKLDSFRSSQILILPFAILVFLQH